MDALHIDSGPLAGRNVEVNVCTVSFRIILTARHLHPATKIVVGDHLRFQKLRGALYSLQGIWLPSADCQAANPRSPRRERMLEARLFLNRGHFKYDVAKLGMPFG